MGEEQLQLEEEEEEEEEQSMHGEEAELQLPLPAQRHQRKLDMKDMKARRTQCNTLAREGTIQRIICGQNGITQPFLNSCADILCKHEFLRVKLGEGAGLERRQAARALEQYLDAVSVHEIGYTITLYRQPGLPRPSNCPSMIAGTGAQQASAKDVVVSVPEPMPAAKQRIPHQRTSLKAAERAAAGKAAAKKQPKAPPEFSVV